MNAATQSAANYKKYYDIWFFYYSNNVFGGTSVEVSASYAAMDMMNTMKSFNQAEIDDDIAYYENKMRTK